MSILGWIAVAMGAFTWSFVEYAMHRFNGHGMRGKTRFSREHLAHHADADAFAPLHLKLMTGSVVATAVFALGGLLTTWDVSTFYTLGFLGGYVFYEVVHFRLHRATPNTAYMRWAARHHFAHHFNAPKHNHGVTSPFWDIVLGTLRRRETVRVPRRLAMAWLVNPLTEDVQAAFASDFRLTGKKRAADRP
jgi:dihydroceramide fatty acyl 2-hydroxylase